MRFAYSLLLYLLTPWAIVHLCSRGARNPAYFKRWGERFGFVAPIEGSCIWVHAVSVGEVRAAAPLVDVLLEHYPRYAVLVTTMTPTGSEQVREHFGDRVRHVYVPYDLPGAVRRFFRRAAPVAAIVMETEYWPNLFARCRRAGIPLLVANVRMSERSMRGYLRFATLTRQTVACVSCFAAQSSVDAQRIRRLGARAGQVRVTGNMKFELKVSASLREAAASLRRDWGTERPVWIAASLHPGEEAAILEIFQSLRACYPDLLLVLVPRHPERFNPVADRCRRAGLRIARRRAVRGPLAADCAVFLGATMGELSLFYAASDVALVGGSLIASGGHNVLEACAVGVPVVFGPHMFNFVEVARLVVEREAGLQVSSSQEAGRVIGELLADANRRFDMGETGQRLVAENRGALNNTLALFHELAARTLTKSPGPQREERDDEAGV